MPMHGYSEAFKANRKKKNLGGSLEIGKLAMKGGMVVGKMMNKMMSQGKKKSNKKTI